MQVNNLFINFFTCSQGSGNWRTQENVDSALEVLPVCENLKVFSIFNCNLERNSKDYFKNFLNLEKLYLWQCHPRLFKSAKNSLNLDFKCELNPVPFERHYICLKRKARNRSGLSNFQLSVKSNPRL